MQTQTIMIIITEVLSGCGYGSPLALMSTKQKHAQKEQQQQERKDTSKL